MAILVGQAKPDEFEQINEVMEESQNLHAEAVPHVFRKSSPVMPKVFFEEILNSEKMDLLVAKDDKEIVGYALLRINESPNYASVNQRIYTYIDDFGIAVNAQGKGVGKKLFYACQEWARKRNSEQMELTVWEFNKKAIAFYESLGMESVNRKMSLSLKDI